MGMGPIPWTSIFCWAQFHFVDDPDDVWVLQHHIRKLEQAHFEFDEKRKPKK